MPLQGAWQAELESERRQLAKARSDIRAGERRVLDQERIVMDLQRAGCDTSAAQRVLASFRATLVEWRRHEVLIRGRIDYLEGQERIDASPGRDASPTAALSPTTLKTQGTDDRRG